jgi:hypothetical protein
MKKLTKEEQEKQQRAVFDRPVQAQRGDIYKVLSKGTCVEFSDKIRDAEVAYKEASVPKQMWKLYRSTSICTLMREEIM